jgi:hypothetical protein
VVEHARQIRRRLLVVRPEIGHWSLPPVRILSHRPVHPAAAAHRRAGFGS